MSKVVFVCIVGLVVVSETAGATEVAVYAASNPWTDTGVVLTEGGYLDISASGDWSGNVNANPIVWYGPEGTGNPAPGIFLVPGVSSAALVGRIDSGPGFLVGLGGRFDASDYGSGKFWLAFNDEIGAYSDNGGYVNVTFTPEPATLLLLGFGGLTLLRKRK